MVRSYRSPAVLMTVYVVVFIYGGPWLGSIGGHRNGPQIAIAVILAVLAARGSRPARILMITYSVLGAFAVLYDSTHWGATKPYAASFLTLACALAQIALLISSPMYQRSRPGRSPGRLQADQFLPWPNRWAVLSCVAGGLVMAVLPFSDGLRVTICPAGGAGAGSSCQAVGYGYPIAYRFASFGELAPRGIAIGAFAADWALWGLAIFLVLYLLQVSRSREAGAPVTVVLQSAA